MITVPLVRQSVSLGRKVRRFELETEIYAATHTMTDAEKLVLDLEIKAIKSGTPLTLSSLTLNLSLDGKFITRASVDLNRYSGISGVQFSVAATGTPATTAVYSGVSAGVGETLSLTELVTNGDFTSSDGWTTGTNWGIGSGVLSSTGSNSNANTTRSLVSSLSAGMLSKAAITIKSRSAGTVSVGTNNGWNVTLAYMLQAYAGYRTATGTENAVYIRSISDFVGSVDDVSLRQVLTPDLTGILASALTNGGIAANALGYDVTVGLTP